MSLPLHAASFDGQVERIEELYSQYYRAEKQNNQLDYLKEIERICNQLRVDYPDRAQSFWLSAELANELANYRPKPLSILEEGKKYAEQAVEINADSARAYFWLAALQGRIGQERGIINSLFMVKPMRDSLERAIELDPQYAPAYDVMAQLYMQAPGWPVSIGDEEKALEYRRKSVRLAPNNYRYQWRLYENCYKLDKLEEAQTALEKVISLTEEMEEESAVKHRQLARKKLTELE
jgi:tetratricopeptide (TPR) repeat protein